MVVPGEVTVVVVIMTKDTEAVAEVKVEIIRKNNYYRQIIHNQRMGTSINQANRICIQP